VPRRHLTWLRLTAGLMLAAGLALTSSSASIAAQIPEKFENLQVLPKDIARQQLVQRMREFSLSLNVRCQHCHTGGDGISFDGVDFKSDDKSAKKKARQMMRMVDEINTRLLAAVPDRVDPPVRVDCVTCHHGLALPKTLGQTLTETIAKEGAPAAVAQYRKLREETMVSGRYDFGEWSVNELARKLKEKGDTASAIAMLEVNGEFNPKSAAVDMMLGELHRERGERDQAIKRYKLALEKSPKLEEARKRLAELEAGNK
jgi:tetratricopeptide (TPR) repeat protein